MWREEEQEGRRRRRIKRKRGQPLSLEECVPR
jgi:hypothetical protein